MDRIITRKKKENVFLEHRFVYVYGPPGIGKTWTVKKAIEPYIELDPETLKSKNATIDFLERAKSSSRPMLIDDFESVEDLIGIRELTGSEHIVIIGNSPYSLSFDAFVYEFPIKTKEELRKIVPSATEYQLEKCKGDIRILQQGDYDDKDVFWTPKDFVCSLICVDGKRNPSDFIGHHIPEHGHVMDMIHDNYIDGNPEHFNEILDCLGIATIFDDKIYEGNWDLLPFFSIESCIRPAIYINHSVKGEIRPGSMWTKYSNTCMREKKVRAMSSRVPGLHLDVDAFMVIRDYFEKGEGEDLIRDYKLETQDIDVLNHLCIIRKLKARTVSNVKKKCQTTETKRKKSTSTSKS